MSSSSASISFADSGLPETSSSTSIIHPIDFLSFANSLSTSTPTDDNSNPNTNTKINTKGTAKTHSTPRPKVRSHHSSPLPSSPSLTPFRSVIPPRSPVSGLSPTKTNTNTTLKRNWNPSLPPPVPSVGDVDRKIGQASPDKASFRNGIAERGLSELYVSNERREREYSPTKNASANASAGPSRHPSALATRDDNIDSTSIRRMTSIKGKGKAVVVDQRENNRRRQGWGETIVSGAVTAGVFGAALGLSAYRLWTTRNDSGSFNDDAQGEEETSSDTAQASVVDNTTIPPVRAEASTPALTPSTATSQPHTAELPPPAYEETECIVKLKRRQREISRDDWEELEELLTPSSSRLSISTSSPYRTRRRHVKGKNSRRFKSSISKAYPIPHHVEIIDCLDGPPSISPRPFGGSMTQDPPLRQEPEQGEDQEEEAVATATTDEVVARLDNMSLQLTSLIEQGRRALESTSGLGVTPGWEDVHGGVDHQQQPPWTITTSRDRSSAGQSEISTSRNSIDMEDTLRQKSTCVSDLRVGHDENRKLGSGSVQERERTRSKIPIRSKSTAWGLVATTSH